MQQWGHVQIHSHLISIIKHLIKYPLQLPLATDMYWITIREWDGASLISLFTHIRWHIYIIDVCFWACSVHSQWLHAQEGAHFWSAIYLFFYFTAISVDKSGNPSPQLSSKACLLVSLPSLTRHMEVTPALWRVLRCSSRQTTPLSALITTLTYVHCCRCGALTHLFDRPVLPLRDKDALRSWTSPADNLFYSGWEVVIMFFFFPLWSISTSREVIVSHLPFLKTHFQLAKRWDWLEYNRDH